MGWKYYLMRAIVRIALWLSNQWIRVLRISQKGKSEERCARPRCHRRWHDHFMDIRLCKKHHPEHEVSDIEYLIDQM